MGPDFWTFIIVLIGAFFYWMLSGFKGKFNDYMSRYHDNDSKFHKNYWTGIGLLVFIIGNIAAIVS